MSRKYIVVDIETANANLSSICQIGIVVFQNGNIIEEWETFINPNTYFDDLNVQLHGIDEQKVKNAPTIQQILPTLQHYFSQGIVCSYGAFDKSALQKYITNLSTWIDITLVVRRTWEEVAYKGYGLSNMARLLKIELRQHHNALDDARTAGLILVKALEKVNFDDTALDKLLTKSLKRLGFSLPDDILNSKQKLAGNPEGEFFGEVVVFTGILSIPRTTAMTIASEKGFDVGNSITKKTTYLVKGVQDLTLTKGKEQSSKELKALELIQKGQNIVFLSEEDFFKLIQ